MKCKDIQVPTTAPDIMAELAELKRQNQELAAKIAAMEEEEEAAHWEETAAEVSAFLSDSAGRSNQSKKTKKINPPRH